MSSDVDPYRVDADGLIDDLENWQAVNWQIEGNGDDALKVPKQPRDPNKYAKSDDASTWGSFDDALENAIENPDLGFGFPCAQPGQPLVFIDVDNPYGGDWVPSYGRLGGCVVERSPSGNHRVILRGCDVPDWWTNQKDESQEETVEAKIFDDTGYVTLTGDVLEEFGPPLEETHNIALENWLKDVWHEFNADADDGSEPWATDSRVSDSGDDDIHNSSEWLDKDAVRDALDHINPDVSYDTWRDIGFALSDFFDSDATAQSVFEEWSRGGTKWDSNAETLADDIISRDKGGRRRTIATVVHLAKQGGWNASAAARSAIGARSDGGAIPEGAPADAGPSIANDPDDELSPNAIIGLALADPFHPLDLDDDGNLTGGVSTINTSQRANYTWKLAQRTGDDDVLAQFKGPIYSFNGDVWRDDDNNRLREIAYEALGDAGYSNRVVNELEDRVRKDRTKRVDELGAPDGTIVTESGLLDLRERETQPVRRDHHALAKIPTEFDRDAECPRWLQFVDESIETDLEKQKFQEYAGYTLWRHSQEFGKALFLVGPTDSGKGTALKAIQQVIGRENVASESLHDLIQTRWGTAQLFGNLANIRNEVTPSGLNNIQRFKELTGGEDEVSAEFKGQDKFDLIVKQKFLFATNEVPTVEHADEAFYNRLLFVRFPNTVEAGDQDKQLLEKLADERSGILNWMLDGLSRLLDQGQFSGELSINGKKEICDAFGGVIDRFTHECLMITGETDDAVKKSDLEALATAYADDIGKDPEWDSQVGFTREFANQRGVGQSQQHIAGKNHRVFTGVRVRPEIVAQYGMEIIAASGTDDVETPTLASYDDEGIRPGYDSETPIGDSDPGVDDDDQEGDDLEGEPLGPHIVTYVRENQSGRDGVPRGELVTDLLDRGAAKTTIDHWIDKCLANGKISEPATDVYRH